MRGDKQETGPHGRTSGICASGSGIIRGASSSHSSGFTADVSCGMISMAEEGSVHEKPVDRKD